MHPASRVLALCSAAVARALLTGLVALAATLFAAPAAQAVTIALEAHVEHVWDPDGTLCVAVRKGDTVRATYTYALGAPDANPLPWVGRYEYFAPPNGFTAVDINGAKTWSDPASMYFALEFANDVPADGSDDIVVVSHHNVPLTCGTDVGVVDWQLVDTLGRQLTDTGLQPDPPLLNMWTQNPALRIEGVATPSTTPFVIDAYVHWAVRIA